MALFFKADDTSNFVIAITDNAVVPTGYSLVEANSVDAAVEKHVPSIDLQRDGHIIHVTVGEVEHPMTDEHFIEWVALEADDRLEVHYLKPGQTPATFFAGGVKSGTIYAYCNLHGLWKATF